MSKETKELKTTEDTWEIKDRTYYLLNNKTPITFTLPSKHTRRFPLLYFDTETNQQREIRYATNQNSVFVDEQQGQCTMRHIIFNDGALFVPKEQQSLQKLLSLYHPWKGKRYGEIDDVQEAVEDLDLFDIQLEAMNAAKGMDIDHAEAILRVEVGSDVNTLSTKEIKRDLRIFAKNNPKTFLALANDENIQLRNFGIKAKEAKIIKLSQDQKTFSWASNGKKLMTVPFDENAYSALASWFQTDEGLEVYKSIEKKFS